MCRSPHLSHYTYRLHGLALNLVIVLLLAGTLASMQAQQVNIFNAFPQNLATEVALDADIVVKAVYPLVRLSVTSHYPDANDNGYVPPSPTVLLLPQATSASTQRVHWPKRTNLGTYSFDDARTLRFKPYRLMPGMEYRCVVADVFIQSPFGQYPSAPLEFTFTTASAVPRILSSTFDSVQVVKCNQPVYFKFNTPPNLGDVFQTLRIEQPREGEEAHWAPAEAQVVIGADPTIVGFTPNTVWTPASSLRVTNSMGSITGDPSDNSMWMRPTRGAGSVKIYPKAVDGRDIPSEIIEELQSNQRVASSGEPYVLSTPQSLGNRWQFVRWESPVFTAPIHESYSHVTIGCDLLLAEIPISAIIERIDTINIRVKVDGEGSIGVYNTHNELVLEIEDAATIRITDSTSEYRLMALPANGNAFTGWTATQGPNNAATGGALIVNAGTVFGAANLLPNQQVITGAFVPLVPGLGQPELFSMRGTLIDADPDNMFDIQGGIDFTTEREFADVVPATQAVCVTAQPCWEIVGYAVSATGKIEFFDTPVNAMCIDADLTRPENIVTFIGRRKEIALRLERTLVEDQNPEKLIRYEYPSSSSTTTIQKKYTLPNGATGWTNMSNLACYRDGIAFHLRTFKCGDEVQFICEGSKLRGEKWHFFGQVNDYTVPAGDNNATGSSSYQMVIQNEFAKFDGLDCAGNETGLKEIRLRACFGKEFGIEAIGVRTRIVSGDNRSASQFRERWLDPAIYFDVLEDEPAGGRHLQYVPRKGTLIKVKFTAPIDVRSINDGGISIESAGNFLVADPTQKNLDFKVSSSAAISSFYPADGKPVNTVELAICDPSTSPILQALHFGWVYIDCLRSIKSLVGQPLLTQSKFSLGAMHIPGVGFHLRSVDFAFDGDNDFIFQNSGEIYHVVYGGNLGQRTAMHTSQGFQRLPDCSDQLGTPPAECTYEHSDKDGPQRFADKLLWIEPYWMDLSDVAYVKIKSYDEDCKDQGDCLVNNVYELLDIVREKTDQHKSTDKEDPLSWESLLPEIVDAGATFVQGLLPVDEQDDILGEVEHISTGGYRWGLTQSTTPEIILKHPNSTYTLVGKFYIPMAVMR